MSERYFSILIKIALSYSMNALIIKALVKVII